MSHDGNVLGRLSRLGRNRGMLRGRAHRPKHGCREHCHVHYDGFKHPGLCNRWRTYVFGKNAEQPHASRRSAPFGLTWMLCAVPTTLYRKTPAKGNCRCFLLAAWFHVDAIPSGCDDQRHSQLKSELNLRKYVLSCYPHS